MADDYRRHKMNYGFIPSLLSDVGRAKAFVRPTKSEKIMTGLGAIFNVVDALEQDRQMEILDQKKLDRSIELGKMRSNAQEYRELKEEYEPIHSQFKRSFMDIDNEDDQDAIIGPKAWQMLKKARPDYFAAHPTMTYEDFKTRKDLVPSQEDNQFYKLANELYTGYRSNLAEKIKMSQKFDEKEFEANYKQAEKLIQGLGSNVLRNSNTLSRITGSDERRIKLADAYLQSKMANMLNAPIIEAENAVTVWENSGQALDLEGVRSQVRDAKLGYFNVLPNNAFVHIKGKNQDLVGFQLSLMRSSVTSLQEELGLQQNELPPKEKIMDAWLLSTIGTFNETDGVKVRRSHLDTQIDAVVKKGGPNVRGEIQALWNEYQRDIQDYADLPAASATQRLNHRKQLKALKAKPNKNREDKKLIAHMEILDDNWGAPNTILQTLLDQNNAKDKSELLEAFPQDVMFTLKGFDDPRITENTRKELVSEVFQGLPFPERADKIATRANAYMMTMINEPEFMVKEKELDRKIAQRLIQTTREDSGRLNVASLNGYKTHWHMIENTIATNNHHVAKLMQYGGDPKKSMFGGMIDSSDPRLLSIFANSIIKNTKEVDGKLFIEDPDQNVIMNSLMDYSKSNLRGTQAFGKYMRINKATKVRSLSDDFYLGSLQLPTTRALNIEEKNRIVTEANKAVQDLRSNNSPTMASELQELIENKFGKLPKNSETGLYNPFTEESQEETIISAIPSDVTTALETAGRSYGLNVGEGFVGNWYFNPLLTGKTIARLRRENPHVKPIEVKLAEAIELSRSINLNAAILQKEIEKEQDSSGFFFDRREKLEEDYQAFNEIIADPYIKEVLKELNLEAALDPSYSINESLKKKVTDEPTETTNIIDSVIDAIVPSAEGATIEADELIEKIIEPEELTSKYSINELRDMVLKARQSEEKKLLKDYKASEKDIDNYMKAYNSSREEAIAFLEDAQIENIRMIERSKEYEKENPPQGFESLLQASTIPAPKDPLGTLDKFDSLLNKASDMYSGTDIISAQLIITMLNSNKIIRGMDRVDTGNKKFVSDDLKRQKDKSKKRIQEGEKLIEEINNSKELLEYSKKIKTLSPSEKIKEFNRLRDTVAALPFGTVETDKQNLIGYKKLAMLFPNKKAGKGGSSDLTITEKVNQYSPNPNIRTRPEVFDRALEFLNSNKFNINDWII